jgi:hypothetical protein
MNEEIVDRESLMDRYVLDGMTGAERQEFESRLSWDDELREDVEFLEDIAEALSRREQNIQMMNQWKQQPRMEVNNRMKHWGWMSFAAAACAALFICVSYPYSYRGLQDRNFPDSQIRGGYGELFELIEDGQYDVALDVIGGSISELENSMPENVHKDYVQSEINYLRWAEIQALLKMKEWELAYDEVSELRMDAGIYQEKADKLYKRLKLRLRK